MILRGPHFRPVTALLAFGGEGLEPSSSALRMYVSQSLTRFFPKAVLVVAFASLEVPHDPPLPHGKDA